MTTLTQKCHAPIQRAEPKGIVSALFTLQARWRQRKHLSEMDAHIREDLGLSEADIQAELRRPFWDAPRNWRR